MFHFWISLVREILCLEHRGHHENIFFVYFFFSSKEKISCPLICFASTNILSNLFLISYTYISRDSYNFTTQDKSILTRCKFLLVASNLSNIGVYRAIINENSSVSIFLYIDSASCFIAAFWSKFKAIDFNEFSTHLNPIFKLLQTLNLDDNLVGHKVFTNIEFGIFFKLIKSCSHRHVDVEKNT